MSRGFSYRVSAFCVVAFWLSTLSALSAARGAERTDKPPWNFVWIVVDDLGARDLGCYGSGYFETPQIDRLAARGVRFTQAYAASTVCSPTRAALLTGQHPARLRLTDWLPGQEDRPNQKLRGPTILQELPARATTLAEALRSAGYTSAAIGKWHLGGSGHLPTDRGFAINLGGTHLGWPSPGYFGFKTPTLKAASPDEYLTDRLSSEAVKFIEAQRERPFFLYLAHFAVHIPLAAKAAAIDHFRPKRDPLGRQDNPLYAAMIASVDEGVGRIVQKLDELGLTDRTLIMLTSDNGGVSLCVDPYTPSTSNAPLRAGKGYLYEGGLRVPLIIAGGRLTPRECAVPVVSMDLMPTMLELAGVPSPEICDGLSLAKLLEQDAGLADRTLYWHYPHYSPQGGQPGAVIRAQDHKLIHFFDGGRQELYDLESDPSETRNLAPEQPEVTRRLQANLDQWLKSVEAQMPTRKSPAVVKP